MKRFRNLIKILIPFTLLLYGCTEKIDIKQDNSPAPEENNTTASKLELLEEIYDNMNYSPVIERYKDKMPTSTSVTRFKYYVIFSELDENTTYNLIDKDIRHTVDAMTNQYLEKMPDSVTPVFFFNDYDAYRDFSVNTFGIEEDDLSPFGFYKISKNIITVRYITWKGSTSHEITHSLIQYDFPDIPSWFNEGFAALHEKYIYKDGMMKGDFSWRILALRRSLKENLYSDLKELMETNDEVLYGKRSSFYYAQARYLLMYIQSKGLLDDYYKLFRKTYEEDNTGITQLEKVMNKPLAQIDNELIDYINSFSTQW